MRRGQKNKRISFGFGLELPIIALKFESEDDLQGGGGGSDRPDPQTQVMEKLTSTMERMGISQAEKDLLNQLRADPDVRAIIEAKGRGEKFRITKGAEEQVQEKEETIDEAELETMSNAKLYKFMSEKLGKSSEKTISKVMERIFNEKLPEMLAPINQQLQGFQQFAGRTEEEKAVNQILETKKKYGDFDKYTDKMVNIQRTATGLSPEELYLVAKLRSGNLPMTTPKTVSERPNSVAARPATKGSRDERSVNPTVGFDQLLRKAAGKAINVDEFEEQ